MDSTKFDSQEIISKYNLSKIIQKKYAINSLPTLLFLNPQGNITDINTGIENDSSFLAKAMNVVNRNENFYDKINQSIENKVKNDSLYNLLTIAQDRGDEYAQNIIATAIYKNAKLNISKKQIPYKRHQAFNNLSTRYNNIKRYSLQIFCPRSKIHG